MLVRRGDLGLEVVEHRVQAVPQVLQADDDADGDDGGDEAIFDGGRTGLVLHKAGENSLHDNTLPVMVRTAHLCSARPGEDLLLASELGAICADTS
jgi:hypothetical protein